MLPVEEVLKLLFITVSRNVGKDCGPTVHGGYSRLTNLCPFNGTVSRDFFTLVFFIKHLLLVPLDTPRKDFEFFQIFKELFEFLIDSPVYSLPGSRDSPVYSLPGRRDSPVYSPLGS
jgi:hypothetical protein